MLSPFACMTHPPPCVYDPATLDDLWTSFVQTVMAQDVVPPHKHLD